jgi:hypothetical protein
MFKRLLGLSLTFGMAATAPPALAANCGDRETVIQQLQSKYNETLTVGGLHNSVPMKTMVEIWSSEKTGTFTVLMTHAQGMTCIMAAGTDFFKAVPREPVKGTAG